MENELLKLVPPNFSDDAAVLVIESEKYLAGVRNLMPRAGIALLTSERTPKLLDMCRELKVDVFAALPTEPKIFDVIIAEDCLTFAQDFYRALLEMNHLLKDSGFLLTKFLNVRFVGVLENLKRGAFPTRGRRFWAKWDVVKILNDATFKEIRFLPGRRFEISAAAWENFGFDNFSDDLATQIWLVKACKCTAEVAALKDLYTPEVRAELSRLLHRIEYDIDAEKNLTAVLELCRREKIFADYFSDFVEQTVTHSAAAKFIIDAITSRLLYKDWRFL